MRHVGQISVSRPKPAEEWDAILCIICRDLGEMITAKGGSLPLLDYVNAKCDLPDDTS